MPEINISIKNCTADSSQCNTARKRNELYWTRRNKTIVMQRLLFKFKTQSNLQVSD